MRWLRLQLPFLYLASVLLAGALPCAGHAAADEAAAPAHQEHAHHAHHAAREAPEPPCHSGEAVCDCKAPAGETQATAKPRDEIAAAALPGSGGGTVPGHAFFQIAQRNDPPERPSLPVSLYDGIHGRAARLLI